MDYPNYKYMEESSNNNNEESKNDYFKINNDNNEKEIENCKNKINKSMKNNYENNNYTTMINIVKEIKGMCIRFCSCLQYYFKF